jgi:hypothetical protein
MATIYDKFKYTNKKNEYGEPIFATRDTKQYKLTRQVYDVKGQIAFKFRVVSYKKFKNSLARDFTSLQTIIVERPRLAHEIDKTIENAKLQAIYAHFRQKGDVDLINDTKRLKNQVVTIDTVDYVIYYSKGYNPKDKTSTLKFVNEKQKNGKIQGKVMVYDDIRKEYQFYSSTELKNSDEYLQDIEDIKLRQEKNYTQFD